MLFALQGHCQTIDGDEETVRPDEEASVMLPADTSVKEAAADTLIWPQEKGDLSTSIIYTAQDSMVMDVPHRKVYLYGKAKVEYGDISLTAERITVDWTKSEMRAFGQTDSTGKYK